MKGAYIMLTEWLEGIQRKIRDFKPVIGKMIGERDRINRRVIKNKNDLLAMDFLSNETRGRLLKKIDKDEQRLWILGNLLVAIHGGIIQEILEKKIDKRQPPSCYREVF